MSDNEIAIGLDIGTGGARAIALDMTGRLVAEGRSALPAGASTMSGPCVEQDPEAWSTAARNASRKLTIALPGDAKIVGISVDATSGTFVLADDDCQPLTRGIMYNDLRAAEETPAVAAALGDVLAPYGITIAPAFALPKIVHLARQDPERFARCHRILHQTDWIVGMLTGNYDVTDISTALKTGADPGTLSWPDALEDLGIPRTVLPALVAPGTPIGEVTASASKATGLPAGTPVIAGCTDGTAGFLASGARHTGDLNVTLGTTMVFKAIAASPLLDPTGAIYNHRHPAGGYLPGASSSSGAEWIETHCGGKDLDALGRAARQLLPTGRVVYPLMKTGERFPFSCPTAAGFGLDELDDPAERFAAGMEGIAYLERLGIERLEMLGLAVGSTVYATGGATGSGTWLSIRAAVNRRTYSVPANPECAVGAAILAAIPHAGSCESAVAALVTDGQTVEPDDGFADRYDEGFARFRAALAEKGYL